MRIVSVIIVVFAFLCAPALAAVSTNELIEHLSDSNKVPIRLVLKVENRKEGTVSVLRPTRDKDWIVVGKVLLPTEKVNENGFTASAWGQTGTLIASAVNAHHIKVGQNEKNGKGIVFSLLPIERKDTDPKQYQSYLSPDSSIYTNILAGTSIFGGGFTPAPGSLAYVAANDNTLPERIKSGYSPKVDDIIYFVSAKQSYQINYIEFENRFGGLVVASIPGLHHTEASKESSNTLVSNPVDVPHYRYELQQSNIKNKPEWLSGKTDAGGRFVVGIVYRPLQGSGRFQGSTFAYEGRIRAVHPGVLCISTSPLSVVGGFQIIPHHHGNSPEMVYARQLTQWLVIGPETATDIGLEGRPPFFTDYFYPSYIPLNDANFSDAERFTQRFIVQAKLQGSDNWVIMPQGIEKLDTVFEKVTHIRIYLPVYSN